MKDAAIGRFSIWPLLESVHLPAAVVFEGGMCEGELHSGVFKRGEPLPNRFPTLTPAECPVPAVAARVRARGKGMNDE